MKLSIIIVNYNVQGFLEHCLYSVQKALKGIEAEVWVVDNNSVDGSVQMVKQKFPEVKLIENKTNYGFSYANNQAIKLSKGEYVLLLNPDTVVEEDTFSKIIAFMDAHPKAGGLGVKMIDGKGNFLPESKRSLPTPEVAFYKIFGLSWLFPKSKRFGKYHLSYLDKDQTHEVEILAGAFMMMRKSVLDKIGLLDETFFMYGEDIDISYRIIKEGYQNYYFADTRIIHYKGESTKKSSVNYVIVFYNAMVIFAKKHFSQKNAGLFSFLINIAIYLRASISIVSRVLKKIALPAFDFLFIYLGVFLIAHYWGLYIKHFFYPLAFLWIVIPFYILSWLFSTYMLGGYDKPLKLTNLVRGIFFGTVFILVFYSLLAEEHRFSRAIILIGSLWAVFYLFLRTYLIHFIRYKNLILNSEQEKRVIIVGSMDEIERVSAILKNSSSILPKFVGKISPTETIDNNYVGSIQQIKEIVTIHRIGEIIFCAKDINAQEIIRQMSVLGETEVDFKIAPPESLYIIGSNSIDTSGDFYTFDLNSIAKPSNQRYKRLLDITVSLFLSPLFPVLVFIIPNPIQFLGNILAVLVGIKSWVGYSSLVSNYHLPKIKKGILNPSDILFNENEKIRSIQQLNTIYAKDYKPSNDLYILWKGYRNLGRS